jgi:hypothetical protein
MHNYITYFFSWPEPHMRFSHHLASCVCCSSSVNFSHFDLLLKNHWALLCQSLMRYSLDFPFSKLCPVTLPYIQDGCNGFWLVEKLEIFENLLLYNHSMEWNQIWSNFSSSGPLSKLCPLTPSIIQDGCHGWLCTRLFEICFHLEFSARPSEFLPDLHFLCKIVLKPSNVIPLLLF